MRYIVYGDEPMLYLESVMAYDLTDTDAVIRVMTEPILLAQQQSSYLYKWLVFQDGKLLPSTEIKELVEKATAKAIELEAEQQKQIAEEMKQKAEQAAKRQEAAERAQYELLKVKFAEAT
jgi:hypothetical protein